LQQNRSSGQPPNQNRYRDADSADGQHHRASPAPSLSLLKCDVMLLVILAAAGAFDDESGLRACRSRNQARWQNAKFFSSEGVTERLLMKPIV
jgi:hypothetical protein